VKLVLKTREDVETLCDDAAAVGNAKQLYEIARGLLRGPVSLRAAIKFRARGIESRLAGRIQAAQAYEDRSEREIALLPDSFSTPITIEVET
jgi:hypothetical protein